MAEVERSRARPRTAGLANLAPVDDVAGLKAALAQAHTAITRMDRELADLKARVPDRGGPRNPKAGTSLDLFVLTEPTYDAGGSLTLRKRRLILREGVAVHVGDSQASERVASEQHITQIVNNTTAAPEVTVIRVYCVGGFAL